MRKKYYRKGKKGVLDAALTQYRATRQKLEADHPGLLKSIQASLLADTPDSIRVSAASGSEPIDRRKTQAIILKFLELSPHSQSMRDEVRGYLSRH